jgi:hypothetical protein
VASKALGVHVPEEQVRQQLLGNLLDLQHPLSNPMVQLKSELAQETENQGPKSPQFPALTLSEVVQFLGIVA